MSLGLIFIVVTLLLARWERFPIFVDIYYHLSIMEMFDQAGGIVVRDFLQYAPVGRDHLYPPLLHTLMLGMYKAGLSVSSIAKVTSASMFPLTMLAAWALIRKAYGGCSAFLTLALLLSSWHFFYTTSVVSASALATVLALATYYFLYDNKLLAATATMTMCLYAHLSYPHLIAFSLVIWAILEKGRRVQALKVLAASYLMFSPWLALVMTNLSSIESTTMAGGSLGTNPILLASAALGLVSCLFSLSKGMKAYAMPVAFMVSMMPILIAYPSRFFVHAHVPLAILGGIGVAWLVTEVRNRTDVRLRHASTVTVLAFVTIVLLFGVTVDLGGQQRAPDAQNPPDIQNIGLPSGPLDKNPALPDHAMQDRRPSGGLSRYLEASTIGHMVCDIGLSLPTYETAQYQILIRDVLKFTDPDDVVVVPKGINGCVITSFTGRATTGGMFQEIGTDDGYYLKQPGQSVYFLPSGKTQGIAVLHGDAMQKDSIKSVPYPIPLLFVFIGIFAILLDVIKIKEEDALGI